MENYKKEDKIVMNFHCAGVVSKEELTIIYIDGDVIVTDEVFYTKERDENRKFSAKTGKCLNDSNVFGAFNTNRQKTIIMTNFEKNSIVFCACIAILALITLIFIL